MMRLFSKRSSTPASVPSAASSPEGRLRILALNWRGYRDPQAGGSEVNIFQQARRWAGQGHEVTVVCADPGREYAEAPVERADGITVRYMGNRVTVYLSALLFYWRHRRSFDCIVDVANGIPFFTPLLARVPGVLLVHHVHCKQWFTEFPYPLAAVGWFLESKVVPRVYRRWPVIAVSPTTRDALLKLGFGAPQVSVVYNGIDLPVAAPAVQPDGKHRIAYVGRIKRYKRLDRLVMAVAQLRREVPDIHLDLAGDGDARAEIEALVQRMHLEDCVSIHGRVDERKKAEILASATVFATPSLQEGWGLSVIEANAFGCPAVAFDVPGLSVAIRDGETGLLAGDEEAFKEALATILNDPSTRSRLSEGARAWAAAFDWESTAMETLRVAAHGLLESESTA